MFDDVVSHLDTMQERDGQTDGYQATAETALTHCVAWQKVYSSFCIRIRSSTPH